jgi:Coenzyme PQQ synthesis protein D (PqqD)
MPEPVEQLDVHEVEDGMVVYDLRSERVHYLNQTASVVFALCTGTHEVSRIVELVRDAWSLEEPPQEEVLTCLAQLRDEGLIR